MARRVALITISDPESRDKGKRFRITEMSADKAERWAWRLSFALLRAGADVPDGAIEAGLAGLKELLPRLAVYGLRSMAGMRYEDAEPLIAELLECVEFESPGNVGSFFALTGSGMTQVEEPATLLRLRYEALQIHLNFSMADALSKSKGA